MPNREFLNLPRDKKLRRILLCEVFIKNSPAICEISIQGLAKRLTYNGRDAHVIEGETTHAEKPQNFANPQFLKFNFAVQKCSSDKKGYFGCFGAISSPRTPARFVCVQRWVEEGAPQP